MQISWKKECAVAMTAILCCSILPEWIPFSAAAAVSYPVQEIRIGVGDTDRNLFAENTTISAQTQTAARMKNGLLLMCKMVSMKLYSRQMVLC